MHSGRLYSAAPNGIYDGVLQFAQAPVKEVAYARKYDQTRLWAQGRRPIGDPRRIHDIVRVPLNDEPWASWNGEPGHIEEPDRGRDGDQVTRRALLRQAQCDVATEGKSADHQ